MCGIFGIISKNNSGTDVATLQRVTKKIFRLSETRGKDASGALAVLPERVEFLKSARRVRELISQPQFSQLLQSASSAFQGGGSYVVAGHTRMVTNGTERDDFNNQPVIKDSHVILHNGIIVNDAALWDEYPTLHREYQVDTEIFGALLALGATRKQDLKEAVQFAFSRIKGANTIAALRAEQDELVVGTTNGSMYYWHAPGEGTIVFASERLIVEKAASYLMTDHAAATVSHLRAGTALSIDLHLAKVNVFSLAEPLPSESPLRAQRPKALLQVHVKQRGRQHSAPFVNSYSGIERRMRTDVEPIRHIRRCTQCIIPETFPHISFDAEGVCDLCRNHEPRRLRGVEGLRQLADRSRKSNGDADCLVPISGGRDSCYGLHYVKNELGLNPIAYTYDWGFVTDLARRNISRMCGELGVEHVLVAADIRQKRENVRKNVEAWLKKPALGMIPLFMAGDKMFFYYASLLRRQMNLGPILFSMNWMEKTGFKTGFADVHDISEKEAGVEGKTYALSTAHKLKLLGFYGKQFITNPAYLNPSIPDTLFAFVSYYMQSKDYDSLFDYLVWDEDTIVSTIIDQYEWEVSPDTRSTWRIGDGTAPFYNHIYYSVAGFSEHDTFRSNQIREGLITREDALTIIDEENQPRVESFKWYCDAVGLDAESALDAINRIPKLYRT